MVPEDKLTQRMREVFDERELRLISNCNTYRHQDPAGLPGHNLMIIISRMHGLLEELQLQIDRQSIVLAGDAD